MGVADVMYSKVRLALHQRGKAVAAAVYVAKETHPSYSKNLSLPPLQVSRSMTVAHHLPPAPTTSLLVES
ncbi:hypothetical protein E2C01_006017 [Portunus trituberculatus]|uniref:Uncharacterized protein n=1 Tax=Portunus trituberculatus TaxID=210409 RepID=A0A5B7CV57_PORTR|nr:hypothetical protein [Portunus trituberculatus]